MTARGLASGLARGLARGIARGSSGGGLALPAGVIGAWYADSYVATPRPHIPNALAAPQTINGMLSGARLRFADTFYWGSAGAVITDRVAAGPSGKTSASTIVGTGGWLVNRTVNIPSSGSYTMVAAVKRNAETDQVFQFFFGGVLSDAFTATAEWQRFTFTLTLGVGSQIVWLRAFNSTNASLHVDEVQVFAGAEDLGTEQPNGHLFLGLGAGSGPTVADNAFDLTDGSRGYIEFEDSFDMATVSTVSMLSKIADGDAAQTFLQNAENWQNLAAYTVQLNAGGIGFAFGAQDGRIQRSGKLLRDRGFHFLGHTYDGAEIRTHLDDIPWQSKAASIVTQNFRSFRMGFTVGGPKSGEKYNSIVLATGWDESQMNQARQYLQSRCAENGNTPATINRLLCAEGDSITAPYISGATQSYAYKYGANADPFAYTVVWAFSGHKVSDMEARAAKVDSMINTVVPGRQYILSVLVGANDYDAGLSTATFLSQLASYLDDRMAAGWTVALGTILPRTTSGFNTWRNTVNATLETWVGVHCDALIPFADDATMGTDAAASNATLYSDGTHPTDTGQTNLEVIYRAVINGL